MVGSGYGQFWGADLKNVWYTAIGRGFHPWFHDLKSRSGDRDQCTILKQKAGASLLNKNTFYIILYC